MQEFIIHNSMEEALTETKKWLVAHPDGVVMNCNTDKLAGYIVESQAVKITHCYPRGSRK